MDTMKVQSKLLTAEHLRGLVLKSERKQIEKMNKVMTIEETVFHLKGLERLKEKLLKEAYEKASKGETSHALYISTVFEPEDVVNIPLIVLQLKHQLSALGYTVSSDSHFSHLTLSSHEFIKIEW